MHVIHVVPHFAFRGGQQVPEVMKEAGAHQFGTRTGILRQLRALQGMFQLADGFAAVHFPAADFEQHRDVFNAQGHAAS